MTTTRLIRTDTKKFKAAVEKFTAAIIVVLERYNAKKTNETELSCQYALNTPAGTLHVHIVGGEVFQCFDDNVAGALATAAIAWQSNPSGKWNWGALHAEMLADPIEAMRYWEQCIDKLMSIPYGYENFAVRLEKWRNNTGLTDQEKLEQVRIRVSDLGAMLADVQQSADPLPNLLYSRLSAIREIVIG